MNKPNKKYYILYKVVKDANNNIIDLEYFKEYTKQENIVKDINCSYRDIKTMINTSYKNDTLNIFKDYALIVE